MITEYNIMMVGVGGTGVLSAASILAEAAIKQGENVRVGEIHGLAQRGGVVHCNVRIGSKVFGPIIMDGKADLLLSFELVETLRAIQKVSSDGAVTFNTHRVIPPGVSAARGAYPDIGEVTSVIRHLTKNVFAVDALKLSKKAGSALAMNVVMLGALVGTGRVPIKGDLIRETVAEAFPKFVGANLRAFDLGYEEIHRRGRR